MITHYIPSQGVVGQPRCRGWAVISGAPSTSTSPKLWTPAEPARTTTGCHGPFRVALHVAPRRQGAGVDSGELPGGAGARRLRGLVLLSGARPAGARCRGQCAAGGDRVPDRPLRA